MNKLITGDNLKEMRDMPDASIDLIYADPPFNTGKDWGAFNDKWDGGLKGYLKFMEPRLVEMHRLLKDTGSIYLHCDTNASHYLKVMMDGIFGMKHFRNEIVWCYLNVNLSRRFFANKHDIILLYIISDNAKWNQYRRPVRDVSSYTKVNAIGERYRETTCNGKAYHYYETQGQICPDWWDDILEIGHQSYSERYGYPTQKPVALLDRIIMASSNQGDVVLDPFCGSGTTLVSANELGRKWIGIDENPDAISISRERLKQLNLFTAA